MRLKNSFIILLKTVSNPQIINEKIIENTATKTVKFNPSLKLGQLTWDLSSSKDSFTYLTIPVILYYFFGGRLWIQMPGWLPMMIRLGLISSFTNGEMVLMFLVLKIRFHVFGKSYTFQKQWIILFLFSQKNKTV